MSDEHTLLAILAQLQAIANLLNSINQKLGNK